ncbi:50S ribosomal protein L25 [Paenibacillus thalictri]|uniref:Large ribosomal subunit protein bL25 n=1 Tax=Paenibacillus thalictri TaxID=2527873 RepID=A0A4Q9DE20_9BACL|nr:50S ribosomal protein L25 [Paenibacillus thalictri]TBL69018.1 50S ribosomal protein L25 [Paenibacillus thalictri]
MATTLKAESRQTKTKSDIRQLRQNGKIPGVVYGEKVGGAPIMIEQKALHALLRGNRHALIELDVPELGKQPVMISEMQRDKLSGELLHIDFHQINMDEPVRATVLLEFDGDSAGVREGGILQIQKHEVEIRCLPQQIPNALQVDVSKLGIGENIHASDLQLPAGVELKSDPGELLVTILLPQKEEPAVEEAAAEAHDKHADEAQAAAETAEV